MADIRDNKHKQKSRRNKKRRTEDFSSDSSSSSSSSSSEDEQQDIEPKQDNVIPPDPAGAMDEIKASVSARLKQIPFTEEIKTSKTDTTKQEELVTQHSKDRDELDKTFLQLMTQQFGDDLDEFRKKPDFSNDSLMVLAQTLQSGSNLFDADEINELVNKTK